MRLWLVVALGACGGGGSSGPDLEISTSFPITTFLGSSPSPLDPLMGATISLDITWPMPDSNDGDGSDPSSCTSRYFYGPSDDVATGASADVVTAQLLDRLPDWDFELQLCSSGGSSIQIVAVIDALNLAIGCFGLPPSAQAIDADGHPDVTSFTATMCHATILDVVNNRTLGSDDFTVKIQTGPARLP
ncbi:MAG: hypothetical protein ABJE66_27575 [Deltaproteobacteria bacterium]